MHWFIRAAAAATAFLTPPALPSRLNPSSLPLITRNPYLSTWLAGARGNPWDRWPVFYTNEEIGFSVLASIPNSDLVYPLLGRPQDSLAPTHYGDGYNVSYPKYLGAQFDASTTNLSYSIPSPDGDKRSHLDITLSFLSPITPTSTLRQSIPASYLNVVVKGGFNVDIYIDLNGQWVSGDRGNQIEWGLEEIKAEEDVYGNAEPLLKTWSWRRTTEQILTEYNDRAEWGTLYFSGPADVFHESGTSALLRQKFARTGVLQDVVDDKFRGIMEEEPVFAFSKSFRLEKDEKYGCTKEDSALFTIAHAQDPVVQFASARGLTLMRPLWKSWFSSVQHLLQWHYQDFKDATKLALSYSQQLEADSLKSGSHQYRDITALSARQVMHGTTFAGTPDDPILFLKEISSDGNMQTIDVFFPAFPFFIYTNPRWLAYIMEPMLEHMLSGQYPNDYAMHDIGAHFPNGTGHPDGNDEYMPVEECGDMLVMALAVVNTLRYGSAPEKASVWETSGEPSNNRKAKSAFPLYPRGDAGILGIDDSFSGRESGKGVKQAQKWVQRGYKMYQQWTRYLVKYSLLPENQLSTDDFAGWLANHTNLALKGIIGIKAMSELADLVGDDKVAKDYKEIANDYIVKWQDYAVSRDGTHVKLAYEWYGSWTTLYSLYTDSLLCFRLEGSSSTKQGNAQTPIGGREDGKRGFVPDEIYKMESDWYHAVRQKYGLPLDSRHLYTKSDWEFWAMAVASKEVRTEMLDSISLWVNETVTDKPLTDLYSTEGDGGYDPNVFFARPVVGGHFSFLALEGACGGKVMDTLKFLDDDDKETEKESWPIDL
ncbi:MAG: hypothetical protein M1814_005653 [Vezdaea aestivalis]|nr:MAG: hypothetical protein M1814_005653 [Vezdaea aestivalis]